MIFSKINPTMSLLMNISFNNSVYVAGNKTTYNMLGLYVMEQIL